MQYKEQIDLSRIPQHVAIIMDGNGRWAKQRGHERSYGHQVGAETVHVISRRGSQTGHQISDPIYVSLPKTGIARPDEVAALMSLLFDSIEEDTFMKNNISFRIIGDIEKLPANVQTRLYNCVENTSKNTGMCLVLALSYSSRWEITEASRQIAALVQKGELTPEQIDCVPVSGSRKWLCKVPLPENRANRFHKNKVPNTRIAKEGNYSDGFLHLSILTAFICLFGCVLTSAAQDANGTDNDAAKPVILYSGTPKKYEIAEIKVEGVKNYEDYVLINYPVCL